MRPWLSVAFLGLFVASAAGASGGIYRYVESDGTVVYTNVAPAPAKNAHRLKGTFRPPPRAAEALSVSPAVTSEFEDSIEEAARRYRIPAALVRAIMHAESRFDPSALSPKGASGLMQLMPETAQEMYVKDIFSPGENIHGGVRYLRVLANLYDGDMVKMIAAYNAGPEAVRKHGGRVPPYAETQSYVRRVLKLYYQYKAGASASSESH